MLRPRSPGRWSRTSLGRLDARTVTTPATASYWRTTSPPTTSWSSRRSAGARLEQVAAELEALYLRLAARRDDPGGDPEVRRRISRRPLIEVDLHMHTDHSPDCATPVDVLLNTARDRGLGAIAITDHNVVSGALEARRIAEEMGDIKVIVAEEVKTAEQGEVIGLFLEEKCRGMTMAETIAEIRRQGGLVYVPHPFDRFHSVPDYEHLIGIVEKVDILKVFNPRVALTAFNEEAERFARKYRIVPGAGLRQPRRPGAGQRAGADPRLRGAAGVPGGDARRRHHPQTQEPRLRAGAEAAADSGRPKAPKRRVPDAKPVRGGRPRAPARRARADAGGRAERSRARPGQRDRRRCPPPTTRSRKYLERAIRELNQLTRELQECPHCPRGKLMPVLGSGHPQADVFMLKHAPAASEIEEGVAFYGRAGNALMKSFKRLGIDPLVVYGTLCVKCPIAEPDLAAEECVRRLVEEIAIVQPKIVVVMGEPALRVLNGLEMPLSRPVEKREGEIQAFTPTVDALYVPDIDDSLDEEGAKQRFWRAFRMLGSWYEDLPPY